MKSEEKGKTEELEMNFIAFNLAEFIHVKLILFALIVRFPYLNSPLIYLPLCNLKFQIKSK